MVRTPFALTLGALLLGANSHAVLAQSATPDAGALLKQQEQPQKRLPEQLPESEKKTDSASTEGAGGVRVAVKSIRFSGATELLPADQLQKAAAEAVGKDLDFNALEALARRITAQLRDAGWILAEAYLPRQEVTAGEIEIAIRDGHLDGEPFALVRGGKRPVRVDTDHLAGIAKKLLPAGAPVRKEPMERAVLLMNDLPGVTARARLTPGAEEGSTRVMIDVEEGPLFAGSATVDNFGNRDTGLNQLTLAAQWNDPAQRGDHAALSVVGSSGLTLGRLSYTLPVGHSGARVGASWSTMQYKIVQGTGKTAGLKGGSQGGGLTASYPLVRTRAHNVHGALGYFNKRLQDDSTAGMLHDKRVDGFTAGLNGNRLDAFGGGGLSHWNLDYTSGQLNLDHLAADAAADAAGYNAQGSYTKLNYGIGRIQRLPKTFTLVARASGQSAGKNLDSSEKMILGGPHGVRAYPGSEASGDAGWLANIEVRYDLPGGTRLGQLQFTAFYDTGSITLHKDQKAIAIPTFTGENSYSLSGWGVGANLSKGRDYAVRFAWAQKIGDNPGRSTGGLDADGHSDDSRLWLQASLWY